MCRKYKKPQINWIVSSAVRIKSVILREKKKLCITGGLIENAKF